jgi:probable F420-dependent oxidoreductase
MGLLRSLGMPDTTASPQLSMALLNFAADDPGDWQFLLDRARAADVAGVDRLVVSDHVVYGEDLDAYSKPEKGGVAGGRQPTGPDGFWLEPLTLLAVVSGVTERVRLGTNILLAALRRPVVLAKSAATLDVLSGGRLDLGVGVGWQREEYVAAGLDFDGRGRLLDHTLEVCQELWRTQRASYSSTELEFDAIHMMPKPIAAGGVPIWVSGTINQRMIRRLARFGSGWIPWGDSAKDLPASIERMREGVSAAGRDPLGIGIVGNLAMVKHDDGRIDLQRTMEAVPALVTSGVTDVRVSVPLAGTSYEQATEVLSEVVQAFHAEV